MTTALLLIDLQNGNMARELAPYSSQAVLGNCVLLAQEMRQRGGMVIFVRVLMNELQMPPADAHTPMETTHLGSTIWT